MINNLSKNRKALTPNNNAAAQEKLSPQAERAVLQQLSWVADSWKRAIERKDWKGLVGLIGLPEIYVEGHPESSDDWVVQLDKLTADFSDLQVKIGDISRSDISAGSARLSFGLHFSWQVPTPVGEDESRQLSLEIHIGFRMRRDAWTPAYLYVDQPRLAPVSPAKAALGSPVPPHNAWPESISLKSPAAATGVSGAPQALPATAPAAMAPSSSQHHLLFVPVVMHEDLVKSLLTDSSA